MLFAVTYTFRASASEATVKRLNTLFGNWQPPKGYEIEKSFPIATAAIAWWESVKS